MAHLPAGESSSKRLHSKPLSKALKKRTVRASFIALNLLVVAAIGYFVLNSNQTSNSLVSTQDNSTAVAAANPLDQVSASDIAYTVAQLNALPEATAVANQAQSAAANIAQSDTADNVVSKPEIVATALKSRADISSYTTVAGDTLSTLATKFGVTSNSIMWSNNLTGNTVNPGTQLTIPPVNGIVYTVKAGDTADSLAQKYSASSAAITAFNDAEISGLTPGEQIIIPNGQIAVAAPVAAKTNENSAVNPTGMAWGSAPIYGYNGYDYGYCTWYVATQVKVPANWGNASTWAYYAGLSGYNVSETPTVGAIAQTALAAGGEGHVAIVDAVSADGSQIQIRDMNGVAGWGRVGYSGWIAATTFQHFITP
jgi:surface antigen